MSSRRPATTRDAIAAFAAADVAAWPGLPGDLHLPDLADALAFDPGDRRPGEMGEPPIAADWVPADTDSYAGGLRLWLAGEAVVALEGIHPLGTDGEFGAAPDLGPADAAFPTLLGTLWLAGGERVYGQRGLAMRVNPDNGLLLGLVGFAPTTAEDYRIRLRPVQEVPRPLRTAVIA